MALSASAGHPAISAARRALDERIPEVALEGISQALKAADFPKDENEAANLLKAEALMWLGKSDEALAILAPMHGAAATLLRAHSLATARRWSEAVSYYEELGEAAPVSAMVGRAEALQILGRKPEAVAVLEKLIASGKAPVSARLRHAGLLTELGRRNEVEALLRDIQPKTAADGKWRDYVKARLLLAEEKWQPSLDALDAIVATPEGVSANLLAAVVLAAREVRLKISSAGSDDAARELEKFLRNHPDNPAIEMVFRRLDQINSQERSPRESELHKMAIEHDDPALEDRAALAQFYICKMQLREKNRRQYAGKSMDTFIAWFPKHRLAPYVREMKAELAQTTGDYDLALESLEAALRSTQDKERSAVLEMKMGLVSYQKGDPSLAVTYFQLATEHTQRLQKSAAFNAALAELGRKNLSGFQARLAEFASNHRGDPLAGELLLEKGFTQARERNADARATLRSFITEYPSHLRLGEAHLVLAELSLAEGKPTQAGTELADAKVVEGRDESGAQAERNQYAEIFATDTKAVEKLIELARSFIARHPKSPLLPDVRMKLGQVYFHEQDFSNAQTQFETIAQEQPDGSYAETGLFLAAECAAKLMTPASAERAKKLFDQVVERKGGLKLYARFQQGLIEHQLDNDATAIFQTILDAQPAAPADLRHATFCAKGDNLVRVAKGSPEKLGGALATYTQLASMQDVPLDWRNQAIYKQGKVLMQLRRAQEALVVFTRLVDSSVTGTKETFWLYKAGFEAASILEGQGSWRSAFAIYEKLGALQGPRAAEAREKVKKLRLSKFIWN